MFGWEGGMNSDSLSCPFWLKAWESDIHSQIWNSHPPYISLSISGQYVWVDGNRCIHSPIIGVVAPMGKTCGCTIDTFSSFRSKVVASWLGGRDVILCDGWVLLCFMVTVSLTKVPRKFLDEWLDNPDVDGWYIGLSRFFRSRSHSWWHPRYQTHVRPVVCMHGGRRQVQENGVSWLPHWKACDSVTFRDSAIRFLRDKENLSHKEAVLLQRLYSYTLNSKSQYQTHPTFH